MGKGLVHETISCDGILINLAGEVKISNVEECQPRGNVKLFLESFCRLSMMLMDKERGPTAKIGLSHLNRWSSEAVDMLTLVDSGPSLEELAIHEFWKRGRKRDLKWLVYFTLITAYHGRS